MRKFDLFPKVSDEDFEVKTSCGGVITILMMIFAIIVVYKQSLPELGAKTRQQAFIDKEGYQKKLINIDVNMSVSYPCQLLHLWLQDVSGNHKIDQESKIVRQKLDSNGRPTSVPIDDSDPKSIMSTCGNCMGSEFQKCCLTCIDIANSFKLEGRVVPSLVNAEQCIRDRLSINEREGCRISARFTTPYTKGIIKVRPGGQIKPPTHFKNDLELLGESVNLSHEFHHLGFGPVVKHLVNPLNGAKYNQPKEGLFSVSYQLHLVKTRANTKYGPIDTVQYSAYQSSSEIIKVVSKKHPELNLIFDTAPIEVRSTPNKQSTFDIIASVCAVIGGSFAVAGMVDSLFYACISHHMSKVE